MKIVNILSVALAFAAGAALSQQSAYSTTLSSGSSADIGGAVGANGVRFRDVDSNRDGRLTQAETQNLLALQNFVRQDTNNDGLLSEPEWGRNGKDPR